MQDVSADARKSTVYDVLEQRNVDKRTHCSRACRTQLGGRVQHGIAELIEVVFREVDGRIQLELLEAVPHLRLRVRVMHPDTGPEQLGD